MIVTFEDYIPVPRFDGVVWRTITIDESASKDGPWTLIDTQNLAPLDADARNPASRSFTTQLATLAEGWYRVSFHDNIGNVLPTDPRQNAAATKVEYKPTVSQVARKNISRTRDAYGNTVGTFTPATEPTDTQVLEIIDDIITEVAHVIGDTIPDDLIDDASNVVALKAAMQVELSFFADQVNTGRSIYPQLKADYEVAWPALQRAVQMFKEGESVVISTAAAGKTSSSFPDPGIGFKTVW